jgi:hypothetical protein
MSSHLIPVNVDFYVTQNNMLWRLLRGSGYGYGAYEETPTPVPRGEGTLDPVDVAGKCKVAEVLRRAQQLRIHFITFACLLVLDVSTFTNEMLDSRTPQNRRMSYTPYCYRRHFPLCLDFTRDLFP